MKYCETCGNQLTDNAVFCPKCGTRVGDNNETPQPVENNNQNQKDGLTTAQKITLGVVAFLAVSGLFSGEWIPAIMCICVLAAVAAIFMGAIETKYAWKAAICCAIAVMIAAVATTDKEESNQSQNQTEQKQESPAEKAEREKKEQADQEANEKQEKIKKVAEMAYKLGYETRKKTWGETLSSRAAAEADYRFRYAKDPEDEGQSERWKVFLENYQKGFSDCADDIIKKFKQEDF